MKKLILIAAAALCSYTLSAQIFVGGRVGVDATGTEVQTSVIGGTSTEVKMPGQFSVEIAPNIGYILNDKLCVGARIPVRIGPNSKDADAKTSNSFLGLGINPYGRYTLLTLGKFGLAAEAGVDFRWGKTTNAYPNFEEKIVKDYTTSTDFEIYVEPVVTYALNDKITLEAGINLFNLGYNMHSTKNTNSEDGDYDVTKDSAFNFGARSNSVFETGAINVGFTYKF